MKTLSKAGLLASTLVATLAIAPAAHAVILSGTFSGLAEASELPLDFTPPLPSSFFEGATVTGTFKIDAADVVPFNGSDQPFVSSGRMQVSYDIKGVLFSFDTDSSGLDPLVLYLSHFSGASEQEVDFLTGFIPKYEGASLAFTGPVGSLFDDLDPTTLHLDPAAPPTLSTFFNSAEYALSVSVDVTELSITSAPSISEPGVGALMLAGLAALSWRWRERRGSPGPSRAACAWNLAYRKRPSRQVLAASGYCTLP